MRFCTKRGVIFVANSVGNLLPQMAYSLTLNNLKTTENKVHPPLYQQKEPFLPIVC